MVSRIGSYKARVGEAPVWHPDEQCLYHIDILGRALIRTDIGDGTQIVRRLPDCPGALALQPGAGVIVALPSLLMAVDGAGAMSAIAELDLLAPDERFNEGTTDTFGRLLLGSCKREAPRGREGRLYRLDPEREPELLLDGFSLINGLAISPGGDVLYVSDSAPDVQAIWTCSYDALSGAVGTPQLLMRMHGHPGRPDGAAIDSEGGYWIAAVDGGAVLRIGRNGSVDARIDVPTAKPSKPVFGGPDYNRLFVTTISEGVDETDAMAGHLLELACPCRGAPVRPARLKP